MFSSGTGSVNNSRNFASGVVREDSPCRSRSVMDSMELQLDKMEICTCKEQPIIYYCDDHTCPRHSSQPFYCQLCMESGIHKHFTHQRIIKQVSLLSKKWQRNLDEFEGLCSSASMKFAEMGPIVRYFELEMLEVGLIQT